MVYSENFAEGFATGGPLQITYYLSPAASIVTNVFGDDRSIASVTIYNGTMPVWSGTMMQMAPNISTPIQLSLGNMTMAAGAGFSLTVPTANQAGQVVFSGQLTIPPSRSQGITLQLAMWNVSS